MIKKILPLNNQSESQKFSLQKTFLITWLGSIILTCILSLLPTVEAPVTFWNSDKVYHFLFYAWLSSLPFLAFRKNLHSALASLSMLYLGITLECMQFFVPGRYFSLADILANGLGVSCGVYVGSRKKSMVTTDRTSPVQLFSDLFIDKTDINL